MAAQKRTPVYTDHTKEVLSASRASAEGRPLRARLATMLGRWIEILVLFLVAISPWLFGGVEPVHEWWLFTGLALGLILWGLRVLLEGTVLWRRCPVVLCTLAIIYLGFAQLLPLPASILGKVSPATERTFEFLLPDQPEALRTDRSDFATQKVANHPLTFYRSSTAQTICRLLAALSLFALVRNNIPAQKGLLRLSIVAFVNGIALSLLAILQLFSSPPTEIYWFYKAPAVVFGPFICRNHFPFYINCCLGLGLGLLIYAQGQTSSSDSTRNGSNHPTRRRHRSSSRQNGTPPAPDHGTTFARAETLWIGAGLAISISAVVLSLSRGGVVVLFATALLGFLFWGRSLLRLSGSATGILVAAAGAFALLAWFGFNLFKDRLETLWQSGGLEARTPLWTSCLPLLGQFPLFGTGYGTFQLVEPLHRDFVSEEFNQLLFVHAHNEFIEAMVEGGIIRLICTLAAIAFVFAAGYRVLRKQHGPAGGLMAGALFAFTTVVLHSIGDFGMHVPAITILIAVLAAHIMGIADDLHEKQARAQGTKQSTVRRIRWGGIAPPLAAGVFAGIGLLLFAQSYHWQLVHRFLRAGLRRNDVANLPQQERRIEYLKTAVALAPDYASTEMELAQAYYEAYSGQQNRLGELQSAEEMTAIILASRLWDGSPCATVRIATDLLPADIRWEAYIAGREAEFEKGYLAPALRYFIVARDLCPLLGKPHARLAAHGDLLARGDKSEQYMERVRLLRKYDPEVWYISGVLEMAKAHREAAWQDWKRSLELSDAFLTDIVKRSLTILSPEELIETVLPESPAQLFRVGFESFPAPKDKLKRDLFMNRALALINQPGRPLAAADRHIKGKALYVVGRPAEALSAYRVAIQHNPTQIDLRVEYAKLLFELGFIREAQIELLAVLENNPGEARAQDMLGAFERELQRQ